MVVGPGVYKVGCCGFAAAQSQYFRLFDVVEIQQTFYQPPKKETAARWQNAAPTGFEFTLKAWQVITHTCYSPTYRRLKEPLTEKEKRECGHFRPTGIVWRAWERTEKIARTLGARIIVFQCPPRFEPNRENRRNLRSFFTEMDRKDYLLVWEPRGAWKREEVLEICRELSLVPCLNPMEPVEKWVEPAYLRLHGIEGYKYRYTDEDLARLLLLYRDRPSYFMFNNVHMLKDAGRFKEMLVH